VRVFAFSGAQRGRITALEGLTSGGSTREIQHILFQLLDFSACAPGVSVAVMRLARGQCVISSCIWARLLFRERLKRRRLCHDI
jgi:hypothetical protein